MTRIRMEWLFAGLLVLAALPIAIAWLAQDALVFYPQRGAPEAVAGSKAVEITAPDGVRLRGWLREAHALRAPTIVYFGGNAEEVSWAVAEPRWPAGWNVAAFNYRGYGTSEGKPSERSLVADALAIHDALGAREEVDPARIVAFGRSLGTGVAVQLAAKRPVAGVILVSPYDSLVAVGQRHYPWLPVDWLLRHRFESIDEAARLTVPLLTLVSAEDALVPLDHSRRLFEAWPGSKQWVGVPGTDHNSVAEPDLFWNAVAAFVARLAP